MKTKNMLLIGIMSTSLFAGCKKEDEPSDNPTVEMHYYFTGNINGSDVSWHVDNSTYKMSMAPYNSMNVSTSNNYIRYGTTIWTNESSQQPFIGVEFSGFLGDINDEVEATNFISYFHVGSYPYSTAMNQDTAIGVNIVYENDNNYLTIHQSADINQPASSSFNVDSLQIIQETNADTKAYVKISFNATLRDVSSAGNDVVISNGILRVLMDNYLEQ